MKYEKTLQKKNFQVECAMICFIKAFLNNQQNITVLEGVEWNKFTHLAEINSISGIMGYMLKRTGLDSVPLEIREKFEREYMSTITITAIRDEDMKSLIELLDRNGIDHLLFKGYVVKDLYTVPELRTFGDIDFAIYPEDRIKCDRLMRQNGYKSLDDWEPVYSYESEIEHYEVHTELLDSNINEKADYRQYFKDFWEHSQKKNAHTYVLEPEYHLMFLLIHIAKHLYGSGAGIRMYLDIAFYLRQYRDTIDWGHFQNEIAALKLSKFVNTVFTVVQEWFDILSPIPLVKLDSDFLERFLTFTLNGGVFGFEDKSSALIQLRKNTSEGSFSRASILLNRAFPPVRNMEARYTYLQAKPWLLPVAWIHRFIKKKSATVEYLNESKAILRTNKIDVIELSDFYINIGL